MSNLTILRRYAQKAPESLPASILFEHSAKNITIFDAFPKSMFHFLILSRIQEPKLDATTLSSLRELLSGDKTQAKEVITALAEDAKAVKKEIQDEMVKRHGFKWDVWTGFHGAPSMVHVHLHVLSADLSLQLVPPKLGFFLHLDDVLSWFDAEPTYFANLVKQLKPSNYEPILKESLSCFHCDTEMKNMPSLKTHLQEEWDNLPVVQRLAPKGNEKSRIEIPQSESDKGSKRAKSKTDDTPSSPEAT
ncbi:hypothetical protein BDZ97DRAFT_1839470 [Flammula alnicola]|nr:hypothetical protein BDZ97DRAFT_1839470 [Flammula alnicola]